MKENYKILVGPPGPNFSWGCVRGLLALSASNHEVKLINSGNGFDDFDSIWTAALNEGEAGNITHVAMLHLDIAPEAGDDSQVWLDTLIAEMDRLDLDYISAVSPLKDSRGLTSSGIGDPDNSWGAWRRFTMKDIYKLPETFTKEDIDPERFLLHNSGCWVADMRKPIWYQPTPNGDAPAYFAFPERVYRDPLSGQWVHARESEDWFFSRCMASMNAKTAITRKVRLTHIGKAGFPNKEPWGDWEHDWASAKNWNVPRGPWDDIQGWFDFADLYNAQIARATGACHFVEVGSWLGKSTTYLASKIKESGKDIKLDCVDTWAGGTESLLNGSVNKLVEESGGSVYSQFLNNLSNAGLIERVNAIVSDSAQAAELYDDGELDFVFIDADHTYEAVIGDLRAWLPKLRTGGVLGGHDFDEEGVSRAVAEFAEETGLIVQRAGMSFVFKVENIKDSYFNSEV
ncbi:MAG: class I SAM-dependent methyltransferase [Candidatus Peribacteraceae bacterium]|nr:class I SAM-dependent methyltransferase [Candidatus Peribacteraceae bacterium]